jgi:DNA-binding CsgD family transcriptional regulator
MQAPLPWSPAPTAHGDDDAAATALTEALRLAWPQGYVRVFADEGPLMAALLGRLGAALRTRQAAVVGAVPPGYPARLARASERETSRAGPAGSAHPGPAKAAVPGLVDPLTEREVQVMRLMADGKPNQQIACELVVSLHTVKKHVTHVLGELGAANRTEATARARDLACSADRKSPARVACARRACPSRAARLAAGSPVPALLPRRHGGGGQQYSPDQEPHVPHQHVPARQAGFPVRCPAGSPPAVSAAIKRRARRRATPAGWLVTSPATRARGQAVTPPEGMSGDA